MSTGTSGVAICQRGSEQLRRVFRSFDIPAYFKLTNALWKLLDKIGKGKVAGPVYHITYENCDATYVVKAERSFKTWFSEYWRKSSVVSEGSQHVHVDRLDHGVSLDTVKLLTVENKQFERGVKETIYIRVDEPSFNK